MDCKFVYFEGKRSAFACRRRMWAGELNFGVSEAKFLLDDSNFMPLELFVRIDTFSEIIPLCVSE